MPTLHQQRCFNHAAREAVARCPECGRFFCRECVTEHDDRLVCAACLAKSVKKPLMRRSGFVTAWRGLQFCAGLMVIWLFFHVSAVLLMKIPSDFHEGTVWQVNWWEKP
jgi:hypothetical protein